MLFIFAALGAGEGNYLFVSLTKKIMSEVPASAWSSPWALPFSFSLPVSFALWAACSSLASSPCPGTCGEGADAILTNPAWPPQTSWSLPTPCRLCMPRHYVRGPQELQEALPKSVRDSQLSKESATTFWALLVFSTQESPLTRHATLSVPSDP